MLLSAFIPLIAVHQSTIRLEFKPPVGQTYHYRLGMDMTMDMSGMAPKSGQGAGALGKPIGMKSTMDVTLQVVKRTGSITTIETKVGSPKFEGAMAGMMQGSAAKMAGKTTRADISSNFEVHSLGGGDSPIGGIASLTMPSHPIHIGESWTSNIDLGKVLAGAGQGMPLGKDAPKLPVKFKLLKVENLSGAKVAVIGVTCDTTQKMNAQGQSFEMHMNMHGNCTIDVGSGIYRDTRISADMSFGLPGKGSMKMAMSQSMTRQ